MSTLKSFDDRYVAQTAGLILKIIQKHNPKEVILDCILCLIKIIKDTNPDGFIT
jgi:hypothetical protein